MTVRPRYPFVALGVPLVVILLFAYGPMVILLIGGMVAGALGCAMPIDAAAGPCPFMGVDHTTFLAFAVALRLPQLFDLSNRHHFARHLAFCRCRDRDAGVGAAPVASKRERVNCR